MHDFNKIYPIHQQVNYFNLLRETLVLLFIASLVIWLIGLISTFLFKGLNDRRKFFINLSWIILVLFLINIGLIVWQVFSIHIDSCPPGAVNSHGMPLICL